MVFKPENELTAAHREAHARSDVNSSFNAQHHTLGDGPTNAASGSHLHGMNPLTATVPANVTKSGASATTKTALCSITVKINSPKDIFLIIGCVEVLHNDTVAAGLAQCTLEVEPVDTIGNLIPGLGYTAAGRVAYHGGNITQRATVQYPWIITGQPVGSTRFTLDFSLTSIDSSYTVAASGAFGTILTVLKVSV